MTCAARDEGHGRGCFAALLVALITVAAAPSVRAAPPAADQAAAVIEGRVAFEGQVVSGVRVFAYQAFDDLTARRPFAVSQPTGDNGKFSLTVPAGTWWLSAKLRAAGAGDGPVAVGDLFSFQGSNPITAVAGKTVHVGFSLVRKAVEAVEKPIPVQDSGAVAGIVTYEGQPLAGVRVSLHTDASENFRGREYASAPPTGTSGNFRLDLLPQGKYYLVARKRVTGAQAGPIAEGDFFGYFLDNPVTVRNGASTEVVFGIASKAGEIGKEDSLFRESGTRIRGRITDRSGRPVKGAYAFAYRDKSMAHRRPAAISKETDNSGNYVLHLAEGGMWYVGARSGYGEGPVSGEWYGRYSGNADHSIRIAPGQTIDEVNVEVEPLP